MYKIFRGVLKKVPTDELFDKSVKGEIDLKEITFEDTLRSSTDEEKSKYLLFRMSYQESTTNGQGKYILNEETQEYEKAYRTTPIISARSKEMRIICELGEYHPVKVVVKETQRNGKNYYDVVCVQDQTKGLTVD